MNIESICFSCDHWGSNNYDGLIGCRAFPGGIPRRFYIDDPHSHDKPFEGQDNDYVYMPAKSKTDRRGDKIRIYQESNPYADENGRYKEV